METRVPVANAEITRARANVRWFTYTCSDPQVGARACVIRQRPRVYVRLIRNTYKKDDNVIIMFVDL